MKNLYRNLTVISTITHIGIGMAHAQTTAYDGFNYTEFTNLVGQASPSPLGTWAGNDAFVNTEGLTYVGLQTSALSMTTSGGGRTTTSVGSTVNSGVQYFSFLANYSFAPTGNGYSTLEFHSTSGNADAFALGISNNGNAASEFMAENQSPTVVGSQFSKSGVSINNNTATHLFVGKIVYSANPGEDVLTWWLDPISLGGAEPAVTNATLTGEFAFDTLRIAKFYSGTNPRYDEIRLGSTFASVTPAAAILPPSVPTEFLATADSFSEISLTWTENSDNETGFRIQRSPDGTNNWVQIASLGADVTSFQDSGLTANTPYFYRIYAYNPGGDSNFSAIVNATTPVVPPPVALVPIYLPFEDGDGTDLGMINPVTGFSAFSGPGVVLTSSALSYPGLTAPLGNGLSTAPSDRLYMTIDTTLPGLANYVSGGQIGGTGLGVIYVRWLAEGINAQEGNTLDFRTAANDNNSIRGSVGTTFGNAFIRAMSSSSATSGIDNYNNSTLVPSSGTDLYVARFTFSPSGVTTMDVFVNQITEGTPDVTTTGAIVFNTIGFSKFGGAPVPSIDEFRIATTWAQAVDASGASAYSTWASGTFANPFTSTGAAVDFERDGITNLMEFVFGGDPTINDTPSIRPTVSASGSDLVVTFKRSDASELQPVAVKVQVSSDLSTWSPADDIIIGATGGSGPNGATYTVDETGTLDTIVVTIPKGTATRKFVRVHAQD